MDRSRKAFPVGIAFAHSDPDKDGMTLREYYAGKNMASLISDYLTSESLFRCIDLELVASVSVKAADIPIDQLEKK